MSKELLCSVVGSQYDKYGNLIDWWGNQSAQQFKHLAQCYVDEYSQFTVYGYRVCLAVWTLQSNCLNSLQRVYCYTGNLPE